MKHNNSGQKAKCWIEPAKKSLSFHYIIGYLEKEFIDRTQMLAYCHQLIEQSYSVQ